MRRRPGERIALALALAVLAVAAAVAVSGAAAADFNVDGGPCRETPGDPLLLRCPTAYVGATYEVQLESEEDSGCYPSIWYEIVNSSLPTGLSMTSAGLISGVPTGTGLTRFWVWVHDMVPPCGWDDRSEREFSIPVDPGLAIVDAPIAPATVGQPYTQTLATKQVTSLNPPEGPDVQATWTLDSGSLPPGITLSSGGVLAGTATAEGSYQFAVKAQYGSPSDTKTYTLTVRQPVVVRAPFGPTVRPSAEVGIPFSRSAAATGGSGTYTWSVSSGALPPGLALDAGKGTVAGTPSAAGTFTFGLTATDADGRTSTVNSALRVARPLVVKTLSLKAARVGRLHRSKVASAGGVQPVTWRLVGGKLPPGIRFARALGTFAGVPHRAGTFRGILEARDALGATARGSVLFAVKR